MFSKVCGEFVVKFPRVARLMIAMNRGDDMYKFRFGELEASEPLFARCSLSLGGYW